MIPNEMQKEKIPWNELCKTSDPQAYDLLDKMLELDHTKRIKPCEVLDHPYFDEIR
jgi:serine/threonine protein kinase